MQRAEQMRVAGHNTAFENGITPLREAGNQPTPSLHQHNARSQIPRRQASLKEPIKSPASHPGEIDRYRAVPPYTACCAHESFEGLHVPICVVVVAKWKARRKERAPQFDRSGRMRGLAIQGEALPQLRCEEFVMGDIVHDSSDQVSPILQRDGNGVRRHAVDEIGRAVQRVDNPATAMRLTRDVVGRGFLAEDRVFREGSQDVRSNDPLGLLVDEGDEVMDSLFSNCGVTDSARIATDERAGGACGSFGNGEFAGVRREDLRSRRHGAKIEESGRR